MSKRRRVLLAAGAVPFGVLLTLIPFVRPELDKPSSADAVILLSGDHGERLPVALRLMGERVAPTLVFLGTIDRAVEDQLCAESRDFEALCVRPQPDSTRHEARAAGRLVKDRGWRKVVVVTSTFHVSRSRMLFDRCVDGTVLVVAAHPTYGMGLRVRQIVHEWLGSVHALSLGRGC